MAVGDLLRRLTAKTMAYAVSGQASALLRPLQFGVGVRGGCEAVVHATRATLMSEDIPPQDKWSLQVDYSNAFNTIDRSHLFKEIREHFPSLAPFFESAYGQPSALNFGGSTILSSTGLHQGCPLAPLGFSVTLQPVIKKVQELPGVVQNTWYLDDGEIVGSKQALVEAWATLGRESTPRGLTLCGDKSVVWCPNINTQGEDPLGCGVARAAEGGIKLLGAPIGDHRFEEEVLQRRLDGIRDMLEHLHLLQDPHIEYSLLRSCLAFPKFAFALRTVDTSGHPDILSQFDTLVKEGMERIVGAPLPPLQADQASLSISQGGLGLRRAEQHGAAAYLSSLGASALLAQEIREQQQLGGREVDTDRAVAELNRHLETPLTYGEASSMNQKELSQKVEKEAAARLHNAAVDQRDNARLNCVSREGAGDWLTAIPSKALGLHLRPQEFTLAVRYRLGLPVFLLEGECPAARCRGHNDIWGDHAVSCAIGGERISKHNHVRDAIFQAAAQAHLGPRKEPGGLLPGSDDRPADVLLPVWDQGRDTALDVCVVNPLQDGLVDRVAREGDAGVHHAFSAKVAKYGARCDAEGISFLPLAVDTFGGWHSRSLDALVKLGRQVARQVGKDEEEVVRQLRQRLSVLLVRDNVAMMGSRTPTITPAEIDGDVDFDP